MRTPAVSPLQQASGARWHRHMKTDSVQAADSLGGCRLAQTLHHSRSVLTRRGGSLSQPESNAANQLHAALTRVSTKPRVLGVV